MFNIREKFDNIFRHIKNFTGNIPENAQNISV